jgi:hypothetical protein
MTRDERNAADKRFAAACYWRVSTEPLNKRWQINLLWGKQQPFAMGYL